MIREMLDKLKESAVAVLPVGAIVIALHILGIARMPFWNFILFLTGMCFFIIGMSIFTLGADIAMMPIGESIGAELTKSKKLWLIIASGFVLGAVMTIAEPDLQVLTKQVPAVDDMVLVISVAAGVGLFLALALIRVIFQIPISFMFLGAYLIVFIVAIFSPDFLAVAFDSGGVTTGPITVPFILAFGVGVSAVRGGKDSEDDSFGLCALCSIGPLLAILIMGFFVDSSNTDFAFENPVEVNSIGTLVKAYAVGFGQFFKEVLYVLLPIIIIFILFQVVRLKMSKTKLIRIFIGILYTLVGLSIFLVGVNIGFMDAGKFIGETIGKTHRWLLIPLGALIGFFIVYAEPAVHVLNHQVEEITSGAISRRMMMGGLSVGVSIGLVLSIIRILSGVSIWFFLLPGYAIALLLMFFTPKLFTSIAFDSGGVAAGTMTAVFLLPFAIGITQAVGGNIMTDAFGIIAMVAMMPLITIQVMGVVYDRKLKKSETTSDQWDTTFVDETLFHDETSDFEKAGKLLEDAFEDTFDAAEEAGLKAPDDLTEEEMEAQDNNIQPAEAAAKDGKPEDREEPK